MPSENSHLHEQPLAPLPLTTRVEERAIWSAPTLQILEMDQVASGSDPGVESEGGFLS